MLSCVDLAQKWCAGLVLDFQCGVDEFQSRDTKLPAAKDVLEWMHDTETDIVLCGDSPKKTSTLSVRVHGNINWSKAFDPHKVGSRGKVDLEDSSKVSHQLGVRIESLPGVIPAALPFSF
jgi:hypothetical protein